MNAAAQTVEADLVADTALQAVVNGAHYWELAPDNAKVPFITFSLRENRRPTKDKYGDYDLVLRCFDDTLTKAATLSELAKDALVSRKHRYLFGESGYTDNEAREAYIELNFNFKL